MSRKQLRQAVMRKWIQRFACISAATGAAFLFMQYFGESPVLAHSDDETDAAGENLDGPRNVSPETAKFIGFKTTQCAAPSMAVTLQFGGPGASASATRRTNRLRFNRRALTRPIQVS